MTSARSDFFFRFFFFLLLRIFFLIFFAAVHKETSFGSVGSNGGKPKNSSSLLDPELDEDESPESSEPLDFVDESSLESDGGPGVGWILVALKAE